MAEGQVLDTFEKEKEGGDGITEEPSGFGMEGVGSVIIN